MNDTPDPGADTTALATMQRWFQSVIAHPEGVAAGSAFGANNLPPHPKSDAEKP